MARGSDQVAMDHPDVEIVPGTEVMRDVGDVRQARAGGTANGSVLIPYPSNDRNDPLNWSFAWKTTVAVSQLLYEWVLVCGALSLAPLFPLLGQEFGLNPQQLSLLTGLNVVTLGLANVLIVPISNILGRRPTSIFFGILVMLTNVWQALATSHESLLVARACNGLVAATSETIMVQTIADMFFLHERGFWMGTYFMVYFAGAALGPIIAGGIGQAHGWRSFFWLTTAMTAFVNILLAVAYPETKWHRSSTAPVQESKTECQMQEKDAESDQTDNEKDGRYVGKGRPSRTQFSPVQKPDSRWWSFIVRDLTTPFIVFFNPIVFWAAMMLAGPAVLLLSFNLTESFVFGSPQFGYNWSPSSVGYSNFAFFISGVVGLLTAGPLSDWWARRATMKNNGIREPEMRLPALIPYVCFFIVSHVSGGLGYQRRWPWQAILVCGFGFSGLAAASIPTIALAYAVDCYKPISGEIMVVATVMKNVLGFSLSYWVFSIEARDDWITVYMIIFSFSMLPVVFTVPLYIWGKSLRRWTKDSGFHRMETLI